jgi:hypothetical protein
MRGWGWCFPQGEGGGHHDKEDAQDNMTSHAQPLSLCQVLPR